MRTNDLMTMVKGAVAISAIAVAPILSTATTFAQELYPAPDSTQAMPATAAAPAPSSIQIAPVAAGAVALPRPTGDPFDFAPAAQTPVQAIGSPACDASASCPVMWRLDAGWAVDTGGPGYHLERLGADDE